MKDLLTRLALVMPENWRLVLGDGRVTADFIFFESERVRDTYELGRRTEVGLAPLTALLKQSLATEYGGVQTHCEKGLWNAQYIIDHNENLWLETERSSLSEFEAVCAAYLATKEAK